MVLTPSLRPPLVKDLFAPWYAPILNQYPIAQYAAADVRRLDAASLSIEQFIRQEYRDRPSDLAQRKFRSLPLYFQHLLLTISYEYTRHPDNYDLLITNVVDGTDMEVLFVTL